MDAKYNKVKYACYSGNVSMAIVSNLPPILFLTFRSLYGVSYSLLGLLVLLNFVTQLGVDLVFSFFSHKFNIQKTVRVMPLLTIVGLLIYALWPLVCPQNVYAGLVIGTLIFSAACGLSEVLVSPVIAAIPSKNPDKEMSKLHSIYAWGVVGVVLVSTAAILLFGRECWQILTLGFLVVPMVSAYLFATSSIPPMQTPKQASGAIAFLKNKGVWLCVAAIFLGGAAECTMAQWCSGYLEQAMGIPKIWGDVFGVALFAIALGTGRSLYAKIGKKPGRALFWGGVGATLCYFISAISSLPMVGLLACAFTGFCVSMLWPGSLIIASDRFPTGGVFIYALMAAGGDLGASIGSQLVGLVTDFCLASPTTLSLAKQLQLQPEQFGLKLGMLVGMLFPLAAVFVYARIRKLRHE